MHGFVPPLRHVVVTNLDRSAGQPATGEGTGSCTVPVFVLEPQSTPRTNPTLDTGSGVRKQKAFRHVERRNDQIRTFLQLPTFIVV